MEKIPFDDFAKVELRVGKVLEAEKLEGSEKLIKLTVDLGYDPSTSSGRDERQILAGVQQFYSPEELVGKTIIVVANLAYRKMAGSESQGMMLAADGEGKPVLLTTAEDVPPGTKIR
jgi:methionine--tRNA ligase beta chain